MALASEGAFEEGAHWVERALDRVPDDPTLRLAAAGFHRRHGDPVRERALLREMLAFPDPEPDLLSVGHHRLARSYGAEGRIEEARREIERALAVEVDATDWRGRPYYRLGLGPVTACWLRLEAAEVEFDAGDPVRGAALVERVRTECAAAGRIRSGLEELEARAVLATPHLEATP
jgi:hypothetical protein